jgi:hypothetical protein
MYGVKLRDKLQLACNHARVAVKSGVIPAPRRKPSRVASWNTVETVPFPLPCRTCVVGFNLHVRIQCSQDRTTGAYVRTSLPKPSERPRPANYWGAEVSPATSLSDRAWPRRVTVPRATSSPSSALEMMSMRAWSHHISPRAEISADHTTSLLALIWPRLRPIGAHRQTSLWFW